MWRPENQMLLNKMIRLSINKQQQGSRLRPKWSPLQPFFESARVKIWRGRTCASACSVLLQSVCFIGERFHWSREERRFQSERFSRAWFTPVSHRMRKQSRGSAEAAHMQSGSSVRPVCFHSPRQHEREGARSGRSATEDLVFKLK